MSIVNFIDMDLIHVNISASSKKRILELISESISLKHSPLRTHDIFDQFIERERLGTTAIGHGIALPHARLVGNDQTIGVFVSLKNAIDFDALDKIPVNILFALLVPQNSTQEHLQILSQLAAFFRHEGNRLAILQADSKESVYQLLSAI